MTLRRRHARWLLWKRHNPLTCDLLGRMALVVAALNTDEPLTCVCLAVIAALLPPVPQQGTTT